MGKPLRHHWSWMVPEEEPITEGAGGGIGTVLWMIVGAAAIFVGLALIIPSLPKGGLAPARATSAPATTPRPTIPFDGGGGGHGSTSSLPNCSIVTDTRTACTNTGSAAPILQEEQPTPAPATGTPEPAYITETCLTPPGARPCWLPADQPWQPPVSVPETPIVLLPEQWEGVPFVRDECADWHPPQPWPEECEQE